ncbi:EamA family transporter [Hahella sp. NBU794]|uniref:EamA family transporter n=1 Tax=Hahella sp. NBU794 TaxID=3422590 RepID=UPI003D6E2323
MWRNHPFALGITAITVAAILFGVAGALAKVLFHANISPLDLTAVRSLVACAVFSLAMLLTQPATFRVSKSAIPLLIATGLAFTAVNITFYYAISMISVAAAITLEYTAPFFVLLISVAFASRRVDLRDAGIVALSVAGCFLLTGGEAELFSLNAGVLVGLACGLAFAIFNMLGNACKQRGVGASTVTLYAFLVSSLLWLAALPTLTVHTIDYSGDVVLYIAFIAIIATIIPYWLLMYGLRHVDALPATIIGMFDPLVAGLVAYALVGERLTVVNMVGIGVIIVAVCLITIKEKNAQSSSQKNKAKKELDESSGTLQEPTQNAY